jgi:hypothetical protein
MERESRGYDCPVTGARYSASLFLSGGVWTLGVWIYPGGGKEKYGSTWRAYQWDEFVYFSNLAQLRIKNEHFDTSAKLVESLMFSKFGERPGGAFSMDSTRARVKYSLTVKNSSSPEAALEAGTRKQ